MSSRGEGYLDYIRKYLGELDVGVTVDAAI
jgi:hypothetical protein